MAKSGRRRGPKMVLRIVGLDRSSVILDRTLPVGVMSERQIYELLRRLAARHLSADEIVSASLKKRARGRRDDLDLMLMSRERFGVSTIGNPYYMAFTEPADFRLKE